MSEILLLAEDTVRPRYRTSTGTEEVKRKIVNLIGLVDKTIMCLLVYYYAHMCILFYPTIASQKEIQK